MGIIPTYLHKPETAKQPKHYQPPKLQNSAKHNITTKNQPQNTNKKYNNLKRQKQKLQHY